jgi:hypothetical protein
MKRQQHHRRSAAEWSKLVAAWARTGQDAAEFASSRGVAPATLTWWRWCLARAAKSGKTCSAHGRSQQTTTARRRQVAKPPRRSLDPVSSAAPRLVPVEVLPEPVSHALTSEVGWEVEDGRGVALRVYKAIPIDALDHIVGAMTDQHLPR